LFLVGVTGGIIYYLEEGSVNFGALGFGVWCVLMGYGAAWLLHRRKSEGHLAAFPCMLIILLIIPVGTVFGVLGLIWLNKGRPLLKQA
jgi:ABC-type molybdate transport system permease subunit